MKTAKTLQDFGFEPGTTEIWYCKKPIYHDSVVPNLETLSDTHELLGEINETDLNRIYDRMQGEEWSPNGEAREFILGLELGHTSMSIQDVIRVNGTYYMVAGMGFRELKMPVHNKADNWAMFNGWFPEISEKLLKNVTFAKISLTMDDGSTFTYERR